MPLKLRLGARGEVDLGQALKDLFDKDEQTLGAVNQLRKTVAELAMQSPIHRDFAAHTVAAASALTYTFMHFDFGGPGGGVPAGWRFDLRQLAVYGTDPFTTASGVTVVAFKSPGAYIDGANAPTGVHALAVGGSVPNTAEWGSREVLLLPGQSLWVCFKSLANNQDVSGYCQVDMVLEGAPLREIDQTAASLTKDLQDGELSSQLLPGQMVGQND